MSHMQHTGKSFPNAANQAETRNAAIVWICLVGRAVEIVLS